jgi:Glycine rich protein
MFGSTLSVRCIASLRAILLYALTVTLLPACSGGVTPLTSTGGASISAATLTRRPASNSQTFQYDGKNRQTFQVPSGVSNVTITAMGAGTPSARGGMAKATIRVHPGDVLAIVVGGAPHARHGGYNGGADGGLCPFYGACEMTGKGGAGASDMRIGGTALVDRILVAGGAGGRGGRGEYHGSPGGEGGGISGGLGDDGVNVHLPYGRAGGGGGGGGGTQSYGGKRGAGGRAGNQHVVPGFPGKPGKLGVGGGGGIAGNFTGVAGGAGGGGGGGYYGGGGGGSGANVGYYEGGGGTLYGVASGGGGGGGSSFVERGAQNVSIETGHGGDKNGLIVISW